MIHLVVLLDMFARGGGGGSAGGGGGGSGGGSGDGLFGIALIGYLPAHYVSSFLYKRGSARMAYVGGSLTAVAVTILFGLFSIGGAILVGIGAIFGVYSGTRNLLKRFAKKFIKAKSVITKAAAKDSAWNEPAIQSRIIDVFYAFQRDWSTFNLDGIRTYTSPRYFAHVRLQLMALKQMGRQNTMGKVALASSEVVEAEDEENNDLDSFTAFISASADDMLVDMTHNKVLISDPSSFQEFWHFDRQSDIWVLDGIRQATENLGLTEQSLKTFAEEQGMYYSADMGWLLMPQRGQLFDKANLGKSDINNHVIGEWNGLVVQLYTYIPFTARQAAENFLIGQINLPKSYGGIIVKRRSGLGWFDRAPGGYTKVSMEWPDFNKRYSVYATDMDKFTSFELLNPAFMADLYDKNLPISIEVVGNVVYFYCRMQLATTHYAEMLKILRRAHCELKM